MGILSNRGRRFQQWRKAESKREYINSNGDTIIGRNNSDKRNNDNRKRNKFIRLIRLLTTKRVHHNNSGRGISIYPELQRPRDDQPDRNTKNHLSNKRHRYHKYLYPIAALLVASPVNAEGVGGVSATANPIANSSGSVTNQAIQVLQGPYITNTYGGGVQCQGSTLNITPYVQFADSRKDPWEDFYNEPQYNMSDFTGRTTTQTVTVKNYPWETWYDNRTKTDGSRWFDDGDDIQIEVDVNGPDGIPDNPGDVSWYKPIRTDMRANQSLNLGVSATLSIPMNKKLMKQCEQAAQAQINMQTQLTANKRLDFELARLKNCGELKKAGIFFHPASPYHRVCADVVVTNPGGQIVPHKHDLPQPKFSSTSSSVPSSVEVVPSSPGNDQLVSPQVKAGEVFSPVTSGSFRSPSLLQVSPPSKEDQPAALLGGPMSLPQPQSPQ